MMDRAHADQLAHGADRTRAGRLFIEHVRSVAVRVQHDPDPYAVVGALLHDTVEKGSFDWSDLRTAGADERLVRLVDALTERDGEPEPAYLARCAADPLALRIKRADIIDKLQVTPGSHLTDAAAAELRTRARRRLALLERVAGRTGTAPLDA